MRIAMVFGVYRHPDADAMMPMPIARCGRWWLCRCRGGGAGRPGAVPLLPIACDDADADCGDADAGGAVLVARRGMRVRMLTLVVLLVLVPMPMLVMLMLGAVLVARLVALNSNNNNKKNNNNNNNNNRRRP